MRRVDVVVFTIIVVSELFDSLTIFGREESEITRANSGELVSGGGGDGDDGGAHENGFRCAIVEPADSG